MNPLPSTKPFASNPLFRRAAVALAMFGLLSTALVAQEAPAQTAPAVTSPALEAPAAPAAATTVPEPAAQPESAAPENAATTPAAGTEPAAVPAESVAPAAGVAPLADAQPAEAAPAPAGSDLPMIETGLDHDLSPVGMFMAADYVVKVVMLGLLAAAVVTWIVLVAKWLQLAGARARARRTLRELSRAAGLADAVASLDRRRGVGVLMVKSAQAEMEATGEMIGVVPAEGTKERVAASLHRIEVAAGRKISAGIGILASIGSVGPFVGLFGTVWGIMNSFIGIAESQTTNLAVVAPGIAEALLATAFGLVAAIPAVVIYNYLARAITGYRQLLSDVSAGVQRLVSRDLDRQHYQQLTQIHQMAAE